jgi:hypothetical protein
MEVTNCRVKSMVAMKVNVCYNSKWLVWEVNGRHESFVAKESHRMLQSY